MNDHTGSDLGTTAATLGIVATTIAVAIHLIPVLVDVAWQVLPSVLVLMLIVIVLRGMVRKLLE